MEKTRRVQLKDTASCFEAARNARLFSFRCCVEVLQHEVETSC